MKSLFEQMGGTYTKVGDYYLPNLLPVEKEIKIGIWGQQMNVIRQAAAEFINNDLIYT